jgi:hypothetical protein
MYFAGPVAGQGLFMGFSAWNEQEIDKAAVIVGQVLRDTAARPHSPSQMRTQLTPPVSAR